MSAYYALLDYMLPPGAAAVIDERCEALAKVIDAWEQGLTVYYPDGKAWRGIAPPSPNTLRGGPAAAVKPDWTCGCGTTLHGDEAVCWRCGAHRKP